MNSRKGAWKIFFTALLLAVSLLGSCALDAPEIEETKVPAQSEQAQLPNPASEHCAEQGGTLEIRMEVGGEVGYCRFADGSECEEWALMRGECKPGQPAAEVDLPEPSEDITARAAKLKPLDMSQSALLPSLADWELAVLDKMKQAAVAMDAAYWQQVDPDDEPLFRSLAGATDPTEAAERLMLDANYGRWDRFDEFVPFMGDKPRPAGGYVYPTDLTKEELDAYIAAHPDDKDGLLSPFTVVRRDGDRLVAVPYHEVYAEFVLPAADLLDQAAALSQNESLATYLRLEAEALRTDEYFDANMAWLDLDSNLDISIGPHEVYDDQLTGQKAFYKANVLIVDRPAAEQLSALMDAVPELQAGLPVRAEYRPDQTGTMTPLEIADDVYRAGQVRAIMEGVAFSLPNDPAVWEAKGAKKVMMGNYLDARRTEVLTPLANAILAGEAAQQLDAQAYFNWVLLHEVSHTLGPRTVEKNGEELTVSEALGEYYSPIEEGKADITGLYEVPYLLDEGILTGSLESHYVGYLAEALRSIRFGPGSAYGMIRSAAWSFFVERGALTFDPAAGKFSVDVGKMTPAVEELVVTLLTIEGEGDTAAAKEFLDKYAYVAPDLQALLDRANATVPVEFVPMSTTE
jgi:putative hemolysin